MTYLVAMIVVVLSMVYLLWIFYLACMAIIQAHVSGKMNYWLWLLAAPFVLVAVLFDVVLNFTVLAVLTLDFPRVGEWTFSQRLSRLVRGGGWREKVAIKIAAILNPFDPSGRHVK